MVGLRPGDGFPWPRVRAAEAYVLALKPWLSPVARVTVITPVGGTDRAVLDALTMPVVDSRGRLLLAGAFCREQPFHVLAGALEHEFSRQARRMDHRLRWVAPSDWQEIAAPALQMEIVDAMECESRNFGLPEIELRLSMSTLFGVRDLDRWGVTEAPSVRPIGALHPLDLGLPEGQSAETYAKMLLAGRRLASTPSAEPPPAASDSSPPGLGASDQEPGDTAPDEGALSVHVAGSEARDGGSRQDDGGGGGGHPGASPDRSAVDGGTDRPSGRLDDDGAGESDPSESEALGASDPGSAPDDESGDAQDNARLLDAFCALERYLTTTLGAAWAESFAHPEDEFALELVADDEVVVELPTPMERLSALREYAASVRLAPQGHVSLTARVLADEILESAKVSWERHLSRLLQSAIQTESVRGSSDISYSVANPNQPRHGVRLMGLAGPVPPTALWLQDVSGSMAGSMGASLRSAADLAQVVATRMNVAMRWVTADTKVVAVGDRLVLSETVKRNFYRGGGGTTLGELVSALMGRGKPPVFEGKTIVAPDILVISTDAVFEWPLVRPSRQHKLIVVIYAVESLAYVPDWVEDREIAIVNDALTSASIGQLRREMRQTRASQDKK